MARILRLRGSGSSRAARTADIGADISYGFPLCSDGTSATRSWEAAYEQIPRKWEVFRAEDIRGG